MNNLVEELKNQLNLDIRELLKIIDIIDGNVKEYKDYKENTLNEENYLREQIFLVNEAKTRLLNIFKN